MTKHKHIIFTISLVSYQFCSVLFRFPFCLLKIYSSVWTKGELSNSKNKQMSIDDEKSEREGVNLGCKSNLAYEFI
jgi:hypothetical protein